MNGENKTINISELSPEKIKAWLFDLQIERERIQNISDALLQELNKRSAQANTEAQKEPVTPKKEKSKAKDK